MRGIWRRKMADNSQIERIGVHKTALFFIEKFDWIVREETILDYGIDMHIEIKDKGEATGVLIALQIKSGNSHCAENKQGNFFTYRGELRHLEYWQNHSLPVIFIWHNPFNQKLYWELVSFESSNINLNEKSWTLKIPSNQTLDITSKDDILNRCFNPNNYQVIEESNNSFAGYVRYSLKVIVFDTNKYIIKKIIKKIHKDYINIYGVVNTLSIYIYRSSNYDELYFCKALWNNPKYEYKLDTSSCNDKIEDIKIEWNNSALFLKKFLLDTNVIISKYKYIKKCDKDINLCNNFIKRIENQDFIFMEKIIIGYKEQIKKKFKIITDESYRLPNEIKSLKLFRTLAINDFDNIIIIYEDSTRTINNKYFLYKTYIKSLKENIFKYEFERKLIL